MGMVCHHDHCTVLCHSHVGNDTFCTSASSHVASWSFHHIFEVDSQGNHQHNQRRQVSTGILSKCSARHPHGFPGARSFVAYCSVVASARQQMEDVCRSCLLACVRGSPHCSGSGCLWGLSRCISLDCFEQSGLSASLCNSVFAVCISDT